MMVLMLIVHLQVGGAVVFLGERYDVWEEKGWG